MPLTNAKLRALTAGDTPFKVSDAEGLFIVQGGDKPGHWSAGILLSAAE